MPEIARFYFRVEEPDRAMERLRELGFVQLEENAPLSDPRPPLAAADPDAGGFVQTVARQLEVMARFGAVVTPRARQRWAPFLSYWTYHPWPNGGAEIEASLPIARRVLELCRELEASVVACLPDGRSILEIPSEEIEARTFPIDIGGSELFGKRC